MRTVTIQGYEDYLISDNGEVFSKYRKLALKGSNNHGYKQVFLVKGDNRKGFLVHRLVAVAFLGAKDGYEINHKNGIKSDNRLGNLEWVTHSDNLKHAYRSGLLDTRGERGPNSRLKWENVREIRSMYVPGKITQKAIGDIYGIGQTKISEIINNRTWVV